MKPLRERMLEGLQLANANAHDAKKQRGSVQASTDRIDLMGIATMLLNCRANCSPAQSGKVSADRMAA